MPYLLSEMVWSGEEREKGILVKLGPKHFLSI